MVLLGFAVCLAACSDESTGSDASPADVTTDVPTDRGSNDVPQTDVPQTDVPQTDVPQTDVPADSGIVDVPTDAPIDVAADVATDAGVDVPASDADDPQALRCTTSGGTVEMSLCCASAPDFPDGCMTGACGCSPSSSRMVRVCRCSGDTCFDPTVGCRAR